MVPASVVVDELGRSRIQSPCSYYLVTVFITVSEVASL